MTKLCIVSYYGLKDSLKSAAVSLNRYYTTTTYPLFQYSRDVNDKKENVIADMIQFLNSTDPDIILWWYNGCSVEFTQLIVSTFSTKIHIYYSWDDPYAWTVYHSNISAKVPLFDHIFTSCESSIDEYEKYGAKQCTLLFPGYDHVLHSPDPNPEYKCDVSFCITNLYDTDQYPDQHIQRKEIIDFLHRTTWLTFHLYGPAHLKLLYPGSYKGYAQYNQLNQIFNQSKLNLTTHVCSNVDNYTNERSIMILGSGGLLATDLVADTKPHSILSNGDNCIVLSKRNWKREIVKAVKQYDDPSTLTHIYKMKKAAYESSKNYTWDKWAECIWEHSRHIVKQDESHTREIYQIDNFNMTVSEFISMMSILQSIGGNKPTFKLFGEFSSISKRNVNTDICNVIHYFRSLPQNNLENKIYS